MKEINVYEHKAQYYETDQMGVIHHSNYIRWFEEARGDLMEQFGLPYKGMEEAGIICAVIEVNVKYHSMVRFDDTVNIKANITQYNGVTMKVFYEIKDKDSGEMRCTGETRHCFLGKDNKPVSLKRVNPKYDNLFKGLISD